MADTWTYAAGVWTLSMDGSGSGQESRSKLITGLTASTLYTFYSTVDPDTVDVGPFIEVDGGDRTTITSTGSQLALVRGTTDGSGNITLRRGVADAGDAPAAAGNDALSYADGAAAATAGWVSAPGSGTITFNTGQDIDSFTTSVKLSRPSGTEPTLTKTFTVTNGAVYAVGIWMRGVTGAPWYHNGFALITSGATTKQIGITGATLDTHRTTNITASGTSLTIQLKASQGTYYFAGLTISGLGGTSDVTWTDWDYCIGTGTPQTPPGIIDPPPEEPPGGYPPPPVGGDRPFIIYDIPTGGLGYWNGTIKVLQAAFAANQLNETTSHEAHNFFVFGATADWLTGGRFDYNKWKAIVDGIAGNATLNALLETAIAAGFAFGHHVIDEPYHRTRYGPGGISLATVERMCVYSKTLWPTWPTLVRVAPTFPWITRHIAGCDWLWAEYLTARGDCLTYRDTNLARTSSLGFSGCIMGLHYRHFTAAETGRDITPSEILHYGKILASGTPSLIPAFGGWKFDTPWYSVPGAAEAVHQLRDYFAGLDP